MSVLRASTSLSSYPFPTHTAAYSYFRQLQEISDTVAEAQIETTLLDTMGELRRQQTQLDTKINAARARQRYMDNLSKSHEEGTMDEDDKTCILCKCDFIRGYITHWYVSFLSTPSIPPLT